MSVLGGACVPDSALLPPSSGVKIPRRLWPQSGIARCRQLRYFSTPITRTAQSRGLKFEVSKDPVAEIFFSTKTAEVGRPTGIPDCSPVTAFLQAPQRSPPPCEGKIPHFCSLEHFKIGGRRLASVLSCFYLCCLFGTRVEPTRTRPFSAGSPRCVPRTKSNTSPAPAPPRFRTPP